MSNPIDTKVISKLAEILDKSNLTELEYEDEGCRISLSKNGVLRQQTLGFIEFVRNFYAEQQN